MSKHYLLLTDHLLQVEFFSDGIDHVEFLPAEELYLFLAFPSCGVEYGDIVLVGVAANMSVGCRGTEDGVLQSEDGNAAWGAPFPSERALPAGGFGSVHTPAPKPSARTPGS